MIQCVVAVQLDELLKRRARLQSWQGQQHQRPKAVLMSSVRCGVRRTARHCPRESSWPGARMVRTIALAAVIVGRLSCKYGGDWTPTAAAALRTALCQIQVLSPPPIALTSRWSTRGIAMRCDPIPLYRYGARAIAHAHASPTVLLSCRQPPGVGTQTVVRALPDDVSVCCCCWRVTRNARSAEMVKWNVAPLRRPACADGHLRIAYVINSRNCMRCGPMEADSAPSCVQSDFCDRTDDVPGVDAPPSERSKDSLLDVQSDVRKCTRSAVFFCVARWIP